MYFKKNDFFISALIVVCLCTPTIADGAYCDSETSLTNSGYYCYNKTVYDCAPGCYCMGGRNQTSGLLSCNNQTLQFGTDIKEAGFAGVYLCPASFPQSDIGANEIEDCYIYFQSKKIYYKNITCEPGKYLPKEKTICDKCLSGYYCPGITTTFSANLNQGLKSCIDGEQPNPQQTGCQTSTSSDIICQAGYFLPADKTDCEICPEEYVCPGGNWKRQMHNQGLEKCGTNQTPSADGKYCETINIIVQPGYYLPANSTNPRQCVGTKQYCPGGTFAKKSSEQGRFTCPLDSDSTYDKTACKIELNQQQMQYGVFGNERCWTKINSIEYKKCVYGNRE